MTVVAGLPGWATQGLAGAVEQRDAADEVRAWPRGARPSQLISVFDGPNPSALRYGREADG